jgi:Histidine kinase-, DNA gyrase B-, and HSP90-like ATPase/DisA bacterial checkpoint controller nucleotide-binding
VRGGRDAALGRSSRLATRPPSCNGLVRSLDPLALHPQSVRHIQDLNLRGTLKELAQLDGAFIVGDDGIVVAACRYLDTSAKTVEVPFGLGSRHLAAASISNETRTIAIVVSDSAVVRVFRRGVIEAEILPELWLLSHWSIAIRDNGIGIAPEHHERVFGLFQRLHSRAQYPGSGIGLATCKRIIERTGGQIWVESVIGQGSTFFFTLPALGMGEGLGDARSTRSAVVRD